MRTQTMSRFFHFANIFRVTAISAGRPPQTLSCCIARRAASVYSKAVLFLNSGRLARQSSWANFTGSIPRFCHQSRSAPL